MKHLVLTASAAVLISACSQSDTSDMPESSGQTEAAVSDFATDDDRIFYALGVAVAENIADIQLTEDEYAFVAAGMRDVVTGSDLRVDMDLYGPQIERLANERIEATMQVELEAERVASAAFADEIAAEPGAERLDSGVIIVPITEGDGANPVATDTVTVHYHGTLRDGSVFDSSVERDSPATFSLSGVIACWTEGVQHIKVGGKAKLLCPADTAYGDVGPPGIPGGAALLFEVELLSIG